MLALTQNFDSCKDFVKFEMSQRQGTSLIFQRSEAIVSWLARDCHRETINVSHQHTKCL